MAAAPAPEMISRNSGVAVSEIKTSAGSSRANSGPSRTAEHGL